MSRKKRHAVPTYRLHKQSGQAVVTLTDKIVGKRKDVLLGVYDTPESHAEYTRIISEWLALGRSLPKQSDADPGKPSDLTISELILAYWTRHVVSYYVKDGRATTHQERIKVALRHLREIYGHTLVKDFGPLALKAVWQKYIEHGYVRRYCNQLIGCLKQCFKWGVAEEIVHPTVFQKLQAVVGLRAGRCGVKEGTTVKPVAWEVVERTLPYLNRHVAAMVNVQRLTGMRSGEVCLLRALDIDMSGPVWTYRPSEHKTQHHGKERVVALGPQAQRIIREFLKLDTQAFLFSPREAEEERLSALSARRKTPLKYGNRPGTNRKKTRKKKPGL